LRTDRTAGAWQERGVGLARILSPRMGQYAFWLHESGRGLQAVRAVAAVRSAAARPFPGRGPVVAVPSAGRGSGPVPAVEQWGSSAWAASAMPGGSLCTSAAWEAPYAPPQAMSRSGWCALSFGTVSRPRRRVRGGHHAEDCCVPAIAAHRWEPALLGKVRTRVQHIEPRRLAAVGKARGRRVRATCARKTHHHHQRGAAPNCEGSLR
jgi:hypothetical protein